MLFYKKFMIKLVLYGLILLPAKTQYRIRVEMFSYIYFFLLNVHNT